MGKPPAFFFYPGDWRRDTQVQMANMETRGIWIEMICCMWDAPERGKLTGTIEEVARMLGCDTNVLTRSLVELERLKIADVTNSHNEVTIINRRMSREEKTKKNARLRKRSQREREAGHNDVTFPSSSTSSSSSISINNIFVKWQEIMDHPHAKLTNDRRNKIQARLKEEYTEEQIIQAIHGCKASSYHMGQNDNKTVYDDLTLICRSGSKLEGFIEKAKNAQGPRYR